jgi:hypothetical protein
MEDPGSTPDETLTSFGVEYALVRRGREVAEALTRSARWNLVAETPGLVLYRRQSPALPM